MICVYSKTHSTVADSGWARYMYAIWIVDCWASPAFIVCHTHCTEYQASTNIFNVTESLF